MAAGTTVLGATLGGYLRRIVRVRDEAALERARRLEVERDAAVTVAAEQERRRIARDLHDVVAHSLTVVVAQADGGRYAARTDPEAAVRSLETVAATARAALADLRTALGVLRSDEGSGSAPLPGLADVPDLVAHGAGQRPPGGPHRARAAARGLRRHRPHRLPGGAGVADQRPQARRARGGGDGRPRARARPASRSR